MNRGTIRRRLNGTPAEYAAAREEQNRYTEAFVSANPDVIRREMDEAREHVRGSLDRWTMERAALLEDINAHAAASFEDWQTRTSDPTTLRRRIHLKGGGAISRFFDVIPGETLEMACLTADDKLRREGWSVPEVDGYDVVDGSPVGGPIP